MKYLRRFTVLALLLAFAGTAFSQPISPDAFRDGPKMRQAFRDVVAKPSEATVRVSVDGKEVAFGAIVEADGWILTKWSEIEGRREKGVTVKLKDGRVFTAKITGVKDEDKGDVKHAYDLAMLKIEAKGLTAVEWRHSTEATVGKWVASVGIDKDPVAVGVVSVATRKLKLGDQPAKFSNFNSGYLGVGLEKAEGGGAKVNAVQGGTPAEKAGFKLNDVIFEAAGRKITDSEMLIATVGRFKPGDKVLFKLRRGEEELELTATLAPRPKELKGNPQETMGTKLSSRRGGFPTILQHDSGIRPEHCGGPLVDLDGKTIGINIARAGRTETYAIPSEDIQPLLGDLKSGKFAPPPIELAGDARKPDFTVTAALKADDKVVTLSAASKDKHFSKTVDVQLSAGATYVFEMSSKEKKLDPYLILQDAKGKELARDDDGGGFPNSKVVFKAPTDGVYRIICTTFNPNETGAYTLSVRRQADGDKEKSKK